jgi:Glycosyl hydrolase catalytic core
MTSRYSRLELGRLWRMGSGRAKLAAGTLAAITAVAGIIIVALHPQQGASQQGRPTEGRLAASRVTEGRPREGHSPPRSAAVADPQRPVAPPASHPVAVPRYREARQSPGHLGPATAAVTALPMKGVSAWAFPGVRRALAESRASWYYTWGPSPGGIAGPPGVQFVPMIWGAGSVTQATLSEVAHEGHVLLGFNEPDLSSQSNMTVSQALQLWPQLMATGMTLGSPAVADDAATPGGWLDRFMRGASARGYRVNFIAVHWYGGDFATAPAVSELKSYLQAIHARYHLPVWLTEFALIRFGATVTFPSQHQQAAFLTAATSMLSHLADVQRYAWFALPATPGDGSAGLFRPGAIATAVGRAFEAAPGA